MMNLTPRSTALFAAVLRAATGLLLAALVTFIAPDAAHGQLTPDRPGFSDGSSVVSPRTFQAEMGYALSANGGTAHELGQLLLRYGLNDAVELRGNINSLVFEDGSDGYSGTGVGAKVRLWRSTLAQLSAVATTSLPTGTGSFDTADDRARQTLRLAFDGALGSGLSMTVNGGISFYYTDDAGTQWLFIPTLNTSLNAQTGLYVGYAGFYAESFDGHWVEGGLTYLVSPNTQLDVNGGLRLNEDANLVTLGLGLAHRF